MSSLGHPQPLSAVRQTGSGASSFDMVNEATERDRKRGYYDDGEQFMWKT